MGSSAVGEDTGHPLERVLDAVPGGVARVAMDGRITSANAEASRLLGLPDHAMGARRPADWAATAIREDGSPCLVEELPVVRVLTTGEPDGPRTFGVRHPDRGLVWLVVRAIPTHDARGALDGALVMFLDVTDRKRAEEDLRRSEEKWRSLAENIPALAIVVDREARIRSINRTLPAYSEVEVIGRCAYDFVDPPSRPIYQCALERTLATGERTTAELCSARPDGSGRWYETTLSLLPESDATERVLVVAQDITERKLAEEAVRAGERRWNLLAESIPDVVAILDRDARIVSVNRAFPDGRSLVGHQLYAFLTTESAEEYRRKFEGVLASRRTARFESRSLGAEREVGAWFETILVPLTEKEGGDVERVLAVARDITDRKRNEEAIRASEQRWRMLVDNLPDIVLVLDRDRRILSANIPGSAGPDFSVVGLLADAFIDETMIAEFQGHVAKALETGDTVRYEIRSAAGVGIPRWYDSVLVPLKTDGVVDRLMIVTRDITSQRALLATLTEKERLASVGMVAASVAHEIMNPLTYVLANLELALGERLDDAAGRRQALVEAREGAKRMQQIVSDLRSLGRAGSEELLYVDARSVIETAVRLSGPEVGRMANVVLDLAEVPGVFVSESRLCQVFINLLINAAQAMTDKPLEEREIRVRTRYDEAPALVAIEVADKGAGIAPFLLERIFDPFFTTKAAGTGLGLSISRDIVTRMGGRIDVTSTVGEGTTFTVWLPATRGEATRAT